MKNIKILHSADWHIDQLSKWSSGKSKKNENLSEFSEYHLAKIEEMVDYAIKNKVNFFTFWWDLFHNSLSNYKEKDVIFKELVRLINKLKDKKIYTIFLSWNHDITRRIKEESKTNSLELLYNINYDKYLYVNSPESDKIDFKDYTINWEKIRIILFPYLRWNKTKEDIFEEISEITEDIDYKKIMIGHLDIFWALYNWVELQSLDLEDTNTWHPEEIEELNTDLVLLWHIHNHQIVWTEKKIIYSGSPYNLSFNEEWVEKWFYIHKLQKDEITSDFIKIDNKKWKTFEINLEETKWSFLSLIDNIKKEELNNSIVRIKLKWIKKKDYKYIPYKEISDLLKDKKIFIFKWYSYYESENTSIEKNKNGIKESLLNNLQKETDPKYILNKFLVEDKEDKEFIKSTLIELEEIINEINE